MYVYIVIRSQRLAFTASVLAAGQGDADGAGTADADEAADDPEAAALADFIINGVCPKCGKVAQRAHRKHLDMCRQRPHAELAGDRRERGELTIAAAIEVEREKLAKMESKLTELDVGAHDGLVHMQLCFLVVLTMSCSKSVVLMQGAWARSALVSGMIVLSAVRRLA